MRAKPGGRKNQVDAKNFGNKRHKSSPQKVKSSLPEGLFVVEGVSAIREYLRYRPSVVKSIFVKERAVKSVRADLQGFQAEFTVVADHGDESTQATPVWAHVKHELMSWNSFLEEVESRQFKDQGTVLVLDHISDPRNLGAIVRSAAFFGIRHVIVPERRQVLLTQAGVNTAQGGFALTDLVVVVNVSRALDELKTKDFWVLGAAMNGEPVANVRGRYKKQVLVLGSEDKGISQGVLGHCDVLVSIPGAQKSLDSLNVSVAAGILIHELRGQA